MMSSCTPIPKPGKTKRRKVDPAHRAATLIAAASDCLLCERLGCVPAHWPRHRGLGGGHAGWDLREWVPLCGQCHDIADARNGVSKARCQDTATARDRLRELAPAWWEHIAHCAAVAVMCRASVMEVLRVSGQEHG